MSEVKTNEPVKQEGDFKIKSKKRTPKKLGEKQQEVIKVNIKEPLVELDQQIKKVVIPSEAIKQRRRCHSNRRNKGSTCGKTIRR